MCIDRVVCSAGNATTTVAPLVDPPGIPRAVPVLGMWAAHTHYTPFNNSLCLVPHTYMHIRQCIHRLLCLLASSYTIVLGLATACQSDKERHTALLKALAPTTDATAVPPVSLLNSTDQMWTSRLLNGM